MNTESWQAFIDYIGYEPTELGLVFHTTQKEAFRRRLPYYGGSCPVLLITDIPPNTQFRQLIKFLARLGCWNLTGELDSYGLITKEFFGDLHFTEQIKFSE